MNGERMPLTAFRWTKRICRRQCYAIPATRRLGSVYGLCLPVVREIVMRVPMRLFALGNDEPGLVQRIACR